MVQDPKDFYNLMQVTMYMVNIGVFLLVAILIAVCTGLAKQTEIVQELQKHRQLTPTYAPPAPAPQPAPPADLPALSIEAMVEARAQELVRQREAARRAMVPPPVKSDTLTPVTPKNPATAAPKPTQAKPITPPRPTT